ncbi:MAG TPA: tetratricopeptide repeat protein [Candidatus Hydrogenedentes bacterium]|nr:tetratricopeptide repeat protein [Candidatus Hydrogenedentota bacterium]
MTPESRDEWRERRLRRILFALILLAALALRLHRIGAEGVCLEEFVGMVHLKASSLWEYLVQTRKSYPFMSPLSFMFEYLWAGMFGYAPATVRMLHVLCGMCTVLLAYRFTTFFFSGHPRGQWAGLAAMLCVALSPQQVFFSQEARQYPFLVFFALASLHTFLKGVRGNGAFWWILNFLANACVMATHLFAMIVPFVEGIVLLIYGRGHIRRIIVWGTAHALVVLPWVAWAATMTMKNPGYPESAPRWEVLLLDWFGDDVIHQAAQVMYSHRTWWFLPQSWAAPIASAQPVLDIATNVFFGACAAGAILFLARAAFRKTTAPSFPEWLLVFLWFFLPPVVLWTASQVMTPMLMPRHTGYASLGLYVMFGGLAAAIPRRTARLALMGVPAFLLFYQCSISLPGPQRTDWNVALDYVRSGWKPGDLLLYEGGEMGLVCEFNLGPVDNPATTAANLESLCDQSVLFLDACARSSDPADRQRTLWALFLAMGRPAFEQCLQSHGIVWDSRDFHGFRSISVYRATRLPDAPLAPIGEVRPNLSGLAKAVRDQPDHAAVEQFRAMIKANPDMPAMVRAKLGLVLALKGAVEVADTIWAGAAVMDSVAAGAITDLCDGMKDDKASASIADALLKNAQRDSARLPVLEMFMQSLLWKNRPERLIETARSLVAFLPDHAPTHAIMGFAREKIGDKAGAIESFKRAIELDPDQGGRTYLSLGNLLRDLGQADKALDIFRAGVARYPDEPWLNASLAISLRDKGDLSGAIAAFNAAVNAGTTDPNLWVLLGDAQSATGDKKAAGDSYQKALAMDPSCRSARDALKRLGN